MSATPPPSAAPAGRPLVVDLDGLPRRFPLPHHRRPAWSHLAVGLVALAVVPVSAATDEVTGVRLLLVVVCSLVGVVSLASVVGLLRARTLLEPEGVRLHGGLRAGPRRPWSQVSCRPPTRWEPHARLVDGRGREHTLGGMTPEDAHELRGRLERARRRADPAGTPDGVRSTGP